MTKDNSQKQAFIQKHQTLFWYFDKNKLDQISDAVLIEFILNYSSMEALKELFELLGKPQVAQVFARSIKQTRHNYFPQVKNFFDLYFQKNVPEYPF